ncbi:hypothetical protein CC2G_009296 [Coprinopsis cinerea AmutBmut pab1-1]|nr:hypothetical protein CC2G_009296 [Coprinopsis cinerea AmutBmut pab1-1]
MGYPGLVDYPVRKDPQRIWKVHNWWLAIPDPCAWNDNDRGHDVARLRFKEGHRCRGIQLSPSPPPTHHYPTTKMQINGLGRPAIPPVSSTDLDAGKQWVINYYTAFDTNDPSFASTFYTRNAVLSFGSAEARGTAGITSTLQWLFNATNRIDHSIRAIHVLHEQLLVQTQATYTFYRGEPRQIDCMTVFHKAPSVRVPVFQKFDHC